MVVARGEVEVRSHRELSEPSEVDQISSSQGKVKLGDKISSIGDLYSLRTS